MKNISKDKGVIYLFNSYSNLDPNVVFISGSDRVGLKLIEKELDNVVVIAPKIFKEANSLTKIRFISSDNFAFQNLYLRYLLRVIYTFKILWNHRFEFKSYKIVSTSDFLPDVIPAFIFSLRNPWFAFTYHLYPLKLNFRDLLGRFFQCLSYLLFLKSAKVITTSSECENFLKKNFRIKNLIKIPLGVDLQIYNKNLVRTKDLVYLGRIKKSKGVFDLPYIIYKVKFKLPDIKLNIIGNGSKEDLQKLEELVIKFGVEKNFNILSNLSDKSVTEVLQKSYILVQPSYEEGFGLSILEGLASGLRVIAYKLPVYQEHFSDFYISYVGIGEKDRFADEIVINFQSNSCIKHNIQFFKKFSWEKIFDKIFIDGFN
jgi:glycosyltransferase involved in cell wall biosynthesis